MKHVLTFSRDRGYWSIREPHRIEEGDLKLKLVRPTGIYTESTVVFELGGVLYYSAVGPSSGNGHLGYEVGLLTKGRITACIERVRSEPVGQDLLGLRAESVRKLTDRLLELQGQCLD